MSKLSSFLHPVQVQEEKEILISNRFVDEEGNPMPFKIRPLTQEQIDAITKQSQRVTIKNGQRQEWFDNIDFNRRIVVAGTVDPDFTSTEVCQACGVLDPTLAPAKSLLAGEFAKLRDAIADLSGFNGDTVEQEAKN